MMSAKTASTQAPAASTAPATGTAASPPSQGGEPNEFQNLLAGVVPGMVEPSLVDTLPTQPLAQFIAMKNAQAQAKLPAAATPAVKAAVVSPADLLKILNDSSNLLPEASDADVAAPTEAPDELPETEETATSDEDILSEWLEVMLPPSVFSPQAGSGDSGEGVSDQAGEAEYKAAAPGIPASLLRQAGTPEGGEIAAAPVNPSATPGVVVNRDPGAAQNPVVALAAAFTQKTEATEKDKPSADGWMSAMGDLAAKRAHDAAPSQGPRLSTPVHDARWADALAHRLVMMARDGESVASLKLVPQDLGPLDIQISVRDGEATVHFGAAQQETRTALEASLPRLRELLGAQGLQLANASVSHQSAGQNRSERSNGGAAGAVAEDADATTAKVVSTSLLDIYA